MVTCEASDMLCCLQEDISCIELLHAHDRTTLCNYSPRETVGNGNCFYRADSLALFGDQSHHAYLRLKMAFKIIDNAASYTPDSASFVLRYAPVLCPEYKELLYGTLTDGSYAELVHFFALSCRPTVPEMSPKRPLLSPERHVAQTSCRPSDCTPHSSHRTLGAIELARQHDELASSYNP